MPLQLTDQQTNVLLLAIRPSRVHTLDGMSHVTGHDIRAMLIRIFGFGGWDLHYTRPPELVFDRPWQLRGGNDGVKVAYRVDLELTVHDDTGGSAVYCGSAIGEATMPDYKHGDAHDMAIKTAETQALKRAATNLGDQFGLGLYTGTMNALVRKVVGHTPHSDDEVTS